MSATALLVGAGWGVRSFLQTGVLPELESVGEVLVLAHPDLVPTLRDRYGNRCAIEPLRPFDPTRGAHGKAYRERNAWFMRVASTVTRDADRARHRRTGPRGRIEGLMNRMRTILGDRSSHALEAAEQRAYLRQHRELSDHYRQLFAAHRARVVVSTTAYLPIETPPVRAARAADLTTACWINSWDNLTSKGPFPIAYDAYFVWSPRMANELKQYYPESRDRPCTAVGVPHFDGYAEPVTPGSRDHLCASVGLDPGRPFVLYAACTPFLAPDEHRVVARLADDLAQGTLPARPQLLVRLHPADPGTRFAGLADRPDVALDMPGAARDGRPAGIYAFCPEVGESWRAIAMIAHADVVVNIASTISLEAAIADRPTINVAYDLAPGSPNAARIAGYYRYDHYRTVTDSGAVRIVHDPASLLAAIRDGLEAPSRQRTERAALAKLWCAAPDHPPADGMAGARLGNALGKLLAIQPGEAA